MESMINAFRNICIGPGPQIGKEITLTITCKDKTTSFSNKTTEDLMTLYYSLFQYADKLETTTNYPTKVELVGDDKKTYFFTTYKKIF